MGSARPRQLVVETCTDVVSELGEGPCWSSTRRELTWVDILSGLLHRARQHDGGLEPLPSLDVGCHVGAAVPAVGGGWMLAAATGFAHLHEGGHVTWLARPEADREGAIRMNDGACDAHGRLWAGSMAYDLSEGSGSVFRLDPDLSLHRMITRTTISNGIAWSRDNKTMWFIDSARGTVDAFDYDLDAGAIARRRTVIRIDAAEGLPDGLSTDEEDCLWVALWGGGQVRRYEPSGRQLAAIEMPVSRPTSCCFGGPDLSKLFITSTREGLSEEELVAEPEAGRLFFVEVGVRGLPSFAFAAGVEAGTTSSDSANG